MTYSRPTTHAVARDGRAERRYELCPACGKYMKDPWQYVCLHCEDLCVADHQATSETRKKPHFILVSSPDPDWIVGGLWDKTNITATLEAGNMTPGTVFRGSQKGSLYVVTEDMRLRETVCA